MDKLKSLFVGLMLAAGSVFAEPSAAPAPGAGKMGGFELPLMLLAIFAIWYFLLIMPQQKKEKKRQAMLNQLKRGDKVITIGGIYGIVEGIKDDVVTLKLGSNNVEFIRSAISRVITGNEKTDKAG